MVGADVGLVFPVVIVVPPAVIVVVVVLPLLFGAPLPSFSSKLSSATVESKNKQIIVSRGQQ